MVITIRIQAHHYTDVTISPMASQITSLEIVYSTLHSGADQRRHQSSASLAFVRRIHRGPVNSPHKRSVTRKMFSFDDVIMSGWRNGRHPCLPIRTLPFMHVACFCWRYGHSRHSMASWRHQMETFSALLAICAGNSPVTGEVQIQIQYILFIKLPFGLYHQRHQ